MKTDDELHNEYLDACVELAMAYAILTPEEKAQADEGMHPRTVGMLQAFGLRE